MKKPDSNIFYYRSIPVHYYHIGEGAPLLLLHGWGSNADVMLPLAGAISDLSSCFIPDLPGFGQTPEPEQAWSVDDYVDFIEVFVKEVVGKPVLAVAHSFGGRMVLKWCARRESDEWMTRAVITGGAGMKPKRSLTYYRKKITAMVLKAPFRLLPGTLQKKAMRWLKNTRIWESLGSSDYRKLEGIMRETFIRIVSEHLEYVLPKIGQEILLLWGKNDEATPWYQAERMEKGLKNGALVGIENAGHYAFLDQPNRFARIVRSFIRSADIIPENQGEGS